MWREDKIKLDLSSYKIHKMSTFVRKCSRTFSFSFSPRKEIKKEESTKGESSSLYFILNVKLFIFVV